MTMTLLLVGGQSVSNSHRVEPRTEPWLISWPPIPMQRRGLFSGDIVQRLGAEKNHEKPGGITTPHLYNQGDLRTC